MPAISRLRRINLSIAVAIATVFSFTAATTCLLEAQEPASIVGSHPLSGLSGATAWINSAPLTAKQLKGKVVLVDFWDYSCINCIRAFPYIRAWAEKYKDSGLVVIGVHTPEFDIEKERANVQKAVNKYGITYPVALDNNYAVWNAFHNQFWPAHYFIDAKGKVRYEHFGEGEYAQSERWIQDLLKEANAKPMPASTVNVHGQGAQAAADMKDVRSPETYIGYARAEHFVSPGGINREVDHIYTVPGRLGLNDWGLAGKWLDHRQVAVLQSAGGKIVFRFHARDLHLVLGPTADSKPVRFRITIDGQAPGENHGVDTDPQGNGVVTEHRLYQLVRQKDAIKDHTFTIEFLDAGVQAFSFTFG
ncbi:thioredoxin family protein [Edaphobacter sp. 12200R-103]|jgi:thiol-disulfide isomerase/thioredoxin|uniref:thioredoxin family protein n=1 Tax=Edaphobacter sp. 12200R-103 TaxID=2703788 RepID=UPI00138C0EFB|nr:thioredoxin family protein [Edaphobacter sp. 12200R-103]QHS53099.1 thioredoxin family protein [Edaphobacter sp. 12200R-103]